MISIPSIRPVITRSSMAEKLVFTTTKSSGTWGGGNTAIIYSYSPKIIVEWGGTGWSGGSATQVYTGTDIGGYYVAAISRTCSGVGTKTVTVFPADNSDRKMGELYGFELQRISSTNNAITTALDFKGARNLQRILLTNNDTTTTSIDLSGLKSLTSFTTTLPNITSVNFTGCSALGAIEMDFSGGGSLNTITGLDSTKNTLSRLVIKNGAITSLDVSNFTSLYFLDLNSCLLLTTLRAQNVMLYTVSSTLSYGSIIGLNGGANLQSTSSMTPASMEQFYTDLATNTSAYGSIIGVYCSGGFNADTTIATNKNYTVIGNVIC